MDKNVDHPIHYGGEQDPYEVIKVAEAWGMDKDAYLFSVLKYIARAGKKDPNKVLEDLKKAGFYLARRIALLSGEVFHVSPTDGSEVSEAGSSDSLAARFR